MNREGLIRELDAQIERLTLARNLLGSPAVARVGRSRRGPRHMSAEARRRISAAQKRRWALRKHGQSGSEKTSSVGNSSQPARRKMSAAGRARIAAAQKARWAAARAEKGQQSKKK